MLPVDWPKIRIPDYQFTKCINIRRHKNGTSLDVMIGYVTKHPEKISVVLSTTWPGKGGLTNNRIFYIKSEEDWKAIYKAINDLWPQVEGKTTESELESAVQKIIDEQKLLEIMTANPRLIDSMPDNLIFMNLSADERRAMIDLIEKGGQISTNTVKKLSEEPLEDLTNFNTILKEYRLATVNALVTHITGRLSFINTFEKAIYKEETYERRGDDSIHNLLRQNIWLVNQNYQILQDDVTLKKIIYENWSRVYLGDASDQRPDFLCMTEKVPRENLLVIIEIKRPSIKLMLSMVEQALKYQQVLSENTGKTYQFNCVLMGKTVDPLLKVADLAKSGIFIKTFSDIIGEARRFYNEYLELVKSNPQAL